MKALLSILLFFGFSAQALVEKKVSFPINDEVLLDGYMTQPQTGGEYPVVVLQMGYGQGSTDSIQMDYNPFAKLARGISAAGFLVLRFDKRGTGYNQANGSYADGRFSDYINDVKAAVQFMKSQPNALPEQIYLYGHSLGGPVISFVAKEMSEVKGIILSHSPGRHYADFNLEQMKYILKISGGPKG